MNGKRWMIVFMALMLLSSESAAALGIEANSALIKVTSSTDISTVREIVLSGQEKGVYLVESPEKIGVFAEKSSISLERGGTQRINFIFNSLGISQGIYTGKIRIYNEKGEYLIPVIFEVQSKDVLFGLNLELSQKAYKSAPGEKVLAEISVYDLTIGKGKPDGVGESRLEMNYSIKSFSGEEIFRESETVTVNNQAKFNREYKLSENMPNGEYILSVSASYLSSYSVSSRVFTVEKKSIEPENEGPGTPIVLIGLAALFVFFLLFGFFIYTIRKRDSLILELSRQNESALRLEKKELALERDKLIKKGYSEQKAHRYYQRGISALGEKYSKRMEKLKELRKNNRLDEMRKKLQSWKREGYDVHKFDNLVNDISTKEKKRMLSVWKAKYKNQE